MPLRRVTTVPGKGNVMGAAEVWAAEGMRIPPRLLHHSGFVTFQDDFIGTNLGDQDDGPWTIATTETGGTPTVDLVADADNGAVALACDDANEVQRAKLHWGDQLNIEPTKRPLIEMRLKLWSPGANEFAVWGLGSNQDDTFSDITRNLWFRLNQSSLSLLIEGDDDSADTDTQDTGVDLVANTWYRFAIDMYNLDAVRFYLDGVELSPRIDVGAMSGNLQPFFGVGKTSGTGTPTMTIDYLFMEWERT